MQNNLTIGQVRATMPGGLIAKVSPKSGATAIRIVSKKQFVDEYVKRMADANTPVTKSQAVKAFKTHRNSVVEEATNFAITALQQRKLRVDGIAANKDGHLTALRLEKPEAGLAAKAEQTVDVISDPDIPLTPDQLKRLEEGIAERRRKLAERGNTTDVSSSEVREPVNAG